MYKNTCILLNTCNRYLDDITAIADKKIKIEKGKLFLILQEGVNGWDPIGSSIKVTGEQIYADRVKQDPEEKQGLVDLDLW